jgi:hypothetical protein
MTKIICSGVSTFVNICCSEISKNKTIYYIQYENIYNNNEYKIDLDQEKIFINLIAFFFHLDVIFIGPIQFSLAPIHLKNEHKNWHNYPNLEINNNDIVTANLLFFLNKLLNGKEIHLFPEGASCLDFFKTKFTYNEKISYIIVKLKRYIKKYAFNKYIIFKTIYIIPDFGNIIEKKLKNSNKFEILSFRLIENNMTRLSEYLFKIFPEMHFDLAKDKIYFHPVIDELDLIDYKNWVEKIKYHVQDNPIILKKHPRDNRAYDNIFVGLNYYWVSDLYKSLPVEIFFKKYKLIYCGFLSTILLSVDINKSLILEPPNKDLIKLYESEYNGMINMLDLKNLY